MADGLRDGQWIGRPSDKARPTEADLIGNGIKTIIWVGTYLNSLRDILRKGDCLQIIRNINKKDLTKILKCDIITGGERRMMWQTARSVS